MNCLRINGLNDMLELPLRECTIARNQPHLKGQVAEVQEEAVRIA